MIDNLVDPYTKVKLDKDSDGNYYSQNGDKRNVYCCYNGCCDFTMTKENLKETREKYDEFYAKGRISQLSLDSVTESWLDDTIPWRKTLSESLGPLSGKRVLLLGNGASFREFYFLIQGANVVFTDLSIVAVQRAQATFRNSELWGMYNDSVEFHAVDAMHMPFPDESFDIIYGSKVVSFLNNHPEFFLEASRCLKPGGICRFVEDAYSPAWDALRTLWRPVKVHILWKSMSPIERVRHGGSPYGTFGFKKESLVPFTKQCGFSRLLFIKSYFFLRGAQLCWAKIFGWDPKRLRYARPLFLAMKWIDNLLANTAWMKRNSLALIFGFDK